MLLYALIGNASTENTHEHDQKNSERLTFMKKNVKSAHAISEEESIRLRFFDRRRADTCM